MRFADRETIEYQTKNLHFIPKYVGFYLGNKQGYTNGFEGDLKDWHLCLGDSCVYTESFEELNFAESIETADPEDVNSLGAD